SRSVMTPRRRMLEGSSTTGMMPTSASRMSWAARLTGSLGVTTSSSDVMMSRAFMRASCAGGGTKNGGGPEPPPSVKTARVVVDCRPPLEGGEAGQVLAEHERVDIVRPLVGVDGLEVRHVAHGLVLDEDAVGAEQTACLARDVAGHVDV